MEQSQRSDDAAGALMASGGHDGPEPNPALSRGPR